MRYDIWERAKEMQDDIDALIDMAAYLGRRDKGASVTLREERVANVNGVRPVHMQLTPIDKELAEAKEKLRVALKTTISKLLGEEKEESKNEPI